MLDIQKSVNRELIKVRKWLESNRLALNLDKTNFVIFQKQTETQINIKFGRKRVSQQTCIKFLGVYLIPLKAGNLTSLNCIKKLSRTVGLLYKIRHYTPLETLKLLYFGIFYQFLSYGVQVWGLTYSTLLNPVFILQKKAVKAMTFSDMTTPSLPLFNKLQLLRLTDISNL